MTGYFCFNISVYIKADMVQNVWYSDSKYINFSLWVICDFRIPESWGEIYKTMIPHYKQHEMIKQMFLYCITKTSFWFPPQQYIQKICSDGVIISRLHKVVGKISKTSPKSNFHQRDRNAIIYDAVVQVLRNTKFLYKCCHVSRQNVLISAGLLAKRFICCPHMYNNVLYIDLKRGRAIHRVVNAYIRLKCAI